MGIWKGILRPLLISLVCVAIAFAPIFIVDRVHKKEINGDPIYKKPKVSRNCDFKVKSPYSLIKWNDSTYGILFSDTYMNWYKVINEKTYHDFSDIIEEGEHFKDSCEAKGNLEQFLNSRPTYKQIK